MSIKDSLRAEVAGHVETGSILVKLGFREMPYGYALMLNADQSHYYWLRYDGVESSICWDRWACYRGALADIKSYQPETTETKPD